MPSEKYMKLYQNFWPKASQLIYELIKKNLKEDDHLCEVGMASGHLLANFAIDGYRVSGYEIRKTEYEKTKSRFELAEIRANIYHEDIMNVEEKFNVIYTTGLLQCLKPEMREQMIEKLSRLAHKVIIVVPKILEDRNCSSVQEVGVAGCCEYETLSLAYVLTKYFQYIRLGSWDAEFLGLKDSFQYFICIN